MRAPAVLAVLAALSADLAFAQTIWRVEDDAPPGGDGLSWATAYRDLQDALAAALPGDQIWVAAGVYRPDRGTGDRDARFELPSDVAIYGGFAGTEDALEQRAGLFEETILSGDLAGDDLPEWENRADNSSTIALVLASTGGVVIDGFYFTGGEAKSTTGSGNGGGGLRCLGEAMVRNCWFVENRCQSASHGGGVHNGPNSSATYLYCVFSHNWGSGGAMYNREASPLVAYCKFLENTRLGSAMYGYGATSAPLVFNSVFAGALGAAGSAIYLDGATGSFINCTISENHLTGSTSAAIRNSGGQLNLWNCILWNNSRTQIRSSDANAVVNYCDVQNGWPGMGNIDADPLFFNPLLHDYRLTFGSPCIDAGDNGALPPEYDTDLEGDPRFVDDPNAPDTGAGTPPLVDMGAYEGPHQGIVISTAELVVTEQGSATFTVAIASNPHHVGADLWVSKVGGDPDLTLVSDPHLRFTGLNYRVPQVVEIRAADDADLDEGRATFRVSWAGVDARDVEVIEMEDDRFVLDTSSVTVTEGDVELFSVALAGDPQRAVEVTVANVNGDPDLLVSDGATLHFDSGNWSLPQVVTIAAAHDADALSRSATIEVSAPGVATATVTAFEADDDPIHVDDDCTPPGDGSPAAPLCTVQQAVDEAINRQEIAIHAGRYAESIVIRGKRVALHSVDGPQVTFLDGEHEHRALRIVDTDGLIEITGLTIENGRGGFGGGIYSEAPIEMSRCVVRGNSGGGYGGGIYTTRALTMEKLARRRQ